MPRRGSVSQLVGRTAELARLHALLDEAAAGRPAVGLLGGDAGIGKTRLLTELAADATERGFLVLLGQCVELGGGGLPYLPFVDALRAASVDPASAETMARAVAERPALARLLDLGTVTEVGEDSGQLPLFSAVLWVFAQLSAEAPVLLVLEDLHWADRSTRDLLSFLSRTLRQEALAVVASYRSDDLHRRHALRPVLTELARVPGVERIDLPPLGDVEIAQLLSQRAEVAVSDSTLQTLLLRAEGNAFFAEELLAAAEDCATEVPGELADVLLGRVEQLAPAAQTALRVASVAGRRVDHRLLAAATALDEAQLDEALREAVGRQLLVTDAAGGYTFRHALLQEAIYGDLLPGERTRLHGVYVELLSRADQPWGRGSAADLAYHSLAGHDLPAALQALDRAAAEAMAVAAPAEALRHLEEALSLWDRVPGAAELVGQPRWRLGLRAAAAASGSGEYSRAVALARACRTVVDPDLEPLVLAEIDERVAYYLLEIDGGRSEAIARGEEALRLVPAEPPTRLRARVLAGHARTLLNTHQLEESAVVADEALACARAVGSAADEAEALTTLAMLAERKGDPETSESLLLESRAVAERGNDATVHLRVLHNLVTAPFERGELTVALARARAAIDFAERHGLAFSGWGLQLRHYAYACYFQMGDWDAAAALTSDSDRVRGIFSAFNATFGAQHLVARGDQRALGQLARVRPFWGEDALLAHLAGCLSVELASWQGDYDRAREQGETAIAFVSGAWPHSLALVRHAALGLAAEADRAALARAVADQTSWVEASSEGERLLALADDAMTQGSGRTGAPGVEARAWWARVVAEKSRLDGVNDPELWVGAVEAFDFGADRDVYEQARGRWRLAEALVQHGRRDEAAEQWRLASDVATRLGAVPLARALEDLRRRARLAAGAENDAGSGLTLTPRELEVLRLVAEGRSNRQIGAALYISDKTASVHVSNLMAKLGATSRTEAAAVAYKSGLLDPPG